MKIRALIMKEADLGIWAETYGRIQITQKALNFSTSLSFISLVIQISPLFSSHVSLPTLLKNPSDLTRRCYFARGSQLSSCQTPLSLIIATPTTRVRSQHVPGTGWGGTGDVKSVPGVHMQYLKGKAYRQKCMTLIYAINRDLEGLYTGVDSEGASQTREKQF